MRDAICQARAHSREFGHGPCFNTGRCERYGLVLCRVHQRMIDRLALAHGDEYGAAICHFEWGRREADLPRVRPDVWTPPSPATAAGEARERRDRSDA